MPEERLRFERATLPAGPLDDSAILEADFAVRAGELVVVHLDGRRPRVPLADAALGLRAPAAGRVACGGAAWSERSAAEAAAARGRIGRVFDGGEWVSNLEVDKNVLLAERHHTDRSEEEVRAEAEAWAARFGLRGLSARRPHEVGVDELRRTACVRALLGDPDLLVLERPTRDAFAHLVDPLLAAVGRARGRGAAVLWTTTNHAVLARLAPVADLVLAARGEHLVPAGGAPWGGGR